MRKRILSTLLALVVLVSYLPATIAMGAETGQSFLDMPDNWATPALKSAIENGLLLGDNGRIMPDSPLTRAQMAAVVTRAFGAVEEGDISEYTDVKSTDWFASSIAKAYKMGVMQGYDGKMDPNSNITREQAFVMLARALKLEPASAANKTFKDENEISDWAKGLVYALVNAGYIQGSNGKLNPKANITRAEFAQMMYNIIKQYIRAAGEYTEVADGNIMVNVPGVTLKNVTINGDLIVGDGVGDGDLVLDNVTVKGRLVVRGGGVNSIIIIGGSVEGKVIIAKVDGNIRVSVEGDADVEVIVIDDGKDDVIVEGTVGTVVANTPGVPVVIQNATVNKIEVNCEGAADITVAEDAEVEDVVVGDKAKGSALNVKGSVTNVETSAADTKISGTGKVGTVNVNKGADNTSVTTPNTEINNKGASSVTAGGGKEVPENESVTNNSEGSDIVTTPPAGGGPSYVAVSAVSIDQEDQLLEIDNTLQLTATISPANATNKRVTWTSSDETVATVDGNGLVTAVGKGTATITVTTMDGNKTDSVTIAVPIVAEDAESLEIALQEADDGDTIVLRAGRYVLDKTLVITKSVKILGPQANVDPRPSKNSPRTDDVNEAVLTGDKEDDGDYCSQEEAKDAGWLPSIFEIRANDVVINGLTLERTYNHIIYSQTADPTGGDNRDYDITGLQILYNIVRHGRGNEGIKIGRSINALVQYNYVHDILYPGDAIEAYDVKGFRILDNEIDGCSSVNGNIRVSNRAGGEPGIIRDNIIKNTEYHFAINAEDGNGDIIIDRNIIENAKAGGIFVYKNTSISEDTPTVIEITNNRIDNYATAPVQGSDYREKYLCEAASAIAVSYNLTDGIQPIVKISGNTTSNGAEGMPVLAFGGGTPDDKAIPTDLSRITVTGNTFDKLYVKFIKVANRNEFDLSVNTWPETEAQKVYNFTKGSVHDNIQDAINEANAGDIIVVGPGTYNESITINKSVILRSSKGALLTKLNGDSATENYYMLNIMADNVVVDGFTITNPTYNRTADASGIVIGSAGRNSNIRVLNCVVHDIGTPDRQNVSFGTFGINVGPVNGLEIAGCHIYNIRNGDANSRAIGIFTWGNNADETVTNVDIHDNIIENIDNPGNNVYGISTGFYGSNITVCHNNIENVKGGIRITEYMQGSVSVTDNTVNNAAVSGITLYGDQDQIVTGNTITGCATGVLLAETCGETAAQVSGNIFFENLVHVQDNRASKPGDYLEGLLEINTFPEASRIIGNKILVPEEGKVYNATTGVEYDTIQAAVNAAASGDTIIVAAGIYEENVEMKNGVDNLKILGAKAGLYAGPSYPPAMRGENESVIKGTITLNGADHVLDGFTVQSGTENGVVVKGRNATIKNNILIGEKASSGSQAGVYSTSFNNLVIINNSIMNYVYGTWGDGSNVPPSIISYNYIAGTSVGIFFNGSKRALGSENMKYFSEKFLSGRTALVTGAAMKLGASIAVELANYGANVIVNYKKLKKGADSVVNIIKSLSQKAMAIQGDVSNEDDVIRIISTTVKEFGSIDILINNAGPWTNSYLKELDSAEWDWIMNSNLKSAFMASKHSAKYMRQKGWGRIINISAGSSFVRNHSVYGLAKNALNVLTESLALELSPKITVNGIAPGMIDVPDVQDDEKVRAIKDTPLRRLVTLKEVASMVVVMCSPLFDTITGHVVTMDGGRTIPREILV